VKKGTCNQCGCGIDTGGAVGNGGIECLGCYHARFEDPPPDLERYEKPIRFAGPPHNQDTRAEDLHSDLVDTALSVAELVSEKNAAYGDSFSRSGEVLKILYPSGVRPDQYGDMLALVRVIDKQFRIAAKKDAFGESPWRDILGYALLSVVRGEGGVEGSRVQGVE